MLSTWRVSSESSATSTSGLPTPNGDKYFNSEVKDACVRKVKPLDVNLAAPGRASQPTPVSPGQAKPRSKA